MVLLASQITLSAGLRLLEADSWNGLTSWIIQVDLVVSAAALFLVLWRERALPRWVHSRLVAVVCLVGAVHVTRFGLLPGWASDLATIVGLAVAVALWTSATSLLLRETMRDQYRRSAGLEDTLLELESNWRGTREQLHEIRSTLAGAVSASRLLSDHTLDPGTHAGLEGSIRKELERLERLLSGQTPAPPEPVDVDATLDVLLASHRARGRDIDWEPNGATVQARPDDVAEALNILLENAATHGGTASRIAVTQEDDLVEIAVSDEGPGVPPEARDRIFDWGVRGSQSPGDGIGLNLARRLVAEQGGSLRLAEPGSRGASFVIQLLAARRSEENHGAHS
jgi:signal transduction histidine kinase